MGITWRDVFRGVGGAATYLANDMKEKRLTKEAEERELRMAYQKGGIEHYWDKKTKIFEDKLAQARAKIGEELQEKLQTHQSMLDENAKFYGSQAAAEAIQDGLRSTDPVAKAASLAKIQLLARAHRGETNFTQDELKIIDTSFHPHTAAYVNEIIRGNKKIAFEMEARNRELNLAQATLSINKMKAEAEIQHLINNPHDYDPIRMMNQINGIQAEIVKYSQNLEPFKAAELAFTKKFKGNTDKVTAALKKQFPNQYGNFVMQDLLVKSLTMSVGKMLLTYKKTFGEDLYPSEDNEPDRAEYEMFPEEIPEKGSINDVGAVAWTIGQVYGAEKNRQREVKYTTAENSAYMKARDAGIETMPWKAADKLRRESPDKAEGKYFTAADGHVYKFVKVDGKLKAERVM